MGDERVLRSMLADESGVRPLAGEGGRMLGVRPGIDIPLNDSGIVFPSTGGLSVSPSRKTIPNHLIPRALKWIYPHARGPADLKCWVLRNATWIDGPVNVYLSIRIDHATHALVEPIGIMSYLQYRQALEETQADWIEIGWEEIA